MIDPREPVSLIEKAVFGHDSRRHPITGRVLEQGSGAHPEKFQAELHCRDIEKEESKEAAAVMRRRLAVFYGAAPTVVRST